MRGDSTRLIVDTIQKQVEKCVGQYMFGYNDGITRTSIRKTLGTYLDNIKDIYDYKVICDETNNTPEMIDNNKLSVDIMMQPNVGIDFITLNTIVTTTGIDFSEVSERVINTAVSEIDEYLDRIGI